MVLAGFLEARVTKWGPCWSFGRLRLTDATHRSKGESPLFKCWLKYQLPITKIAGKLFHHLTTIDYLISINYSNIWHLISLSTGPAAGPNALQDHGNITSILANRRHNNLFLARRIFFLTGINGPKYSESDPKESHRRSSLKVDLLGVSKDRC